jgi:hypothetical protein
MKKEGSSSFFKKGAKKLLFITTRTNRTIRATNKAKVFWFFFSKKNYFLPFSFLTFFILLPHRAHAHLASTGLGPAYDGIYHFALTPEQVLPIAVLALFAGRRGPAHARAVTIFFPLAWLIGCLLQFTPTPALAALAPAIALLAAGILLASDLVIPTVATGGLAVILGLALGGLYGVPTGALAGSLAAAACGFVLLALLTSVSLPLRRMPAIIAVRVAGSWTAALGLLLVGWFLHGHS